MSNRLTTEQKVRVTVAPKTAAGHDAKIDGSVTWESSDTSVARLEPIDETSAFVIAGSAGVAQITASFDADLGEGVRTLNASGAVEVVNAEAETAEIVFGEPETNG